MHLTRMPGQDLRKDGGHNFNTFTCFSSIYYVDKKNKEIMPTEAKKEYLHLFQTQAQHDAAHTRSNENYIEPWVAYTLENEEVSFNLPTTTHVTTSQQ